MEEMKIGQFIRDRRIELGMTQQQLADRLYVSRQTVSRWESGTRCPDLITAKKLAMELQISLDELISDEEIKDMESLYFWRGSRWEEKQRLKEYKRRLYRVLEGFGSVFIVIMLFFLGGLKTKLPVWCTVAGGVIYIFIRVLIWRADKKLNEMEE